MCDVHARPLSWPRSLLQFRASFPDNLRNAGCKGDPRNPGARLAEDWKLWLTPSLEDSIILWIPGCLQRCTKTTRTGSLATRTSGTSGPWSSRWSRECSTIFTFTYTYVNLPLLPGCFIFPAYLCQTHKEQMKISEYIQKPNLFSTMHIWTNNCDRVVASYYVSIVLYHMWLGPHTWVKIS